jgi:hypothetical protein
MERSGLALSSCLIKFSAIIGECVHPLDCLYSDQVETGLGPFIADTTIGFEIIGTQRELHGIADGVRFWQTTMDLIAYQFAPAIIAL